MDMINPYSLTDAALFSDQFYFYNLTINTIVIKL